jgi:prepilin-type N-terminal cleavage/methylation domain-containing protein
VQHIIANADRSAARRGFTIVEMMIVLTIIGIVATMCVPTFQRAIEQSEADIAAANLRTIWAAERLYWLEYHSYTADLTALQGLKLLDPSLPTTSGSQVLGGYTYAINSQANANGFNATATRSDLGSFSIDQDGALSGTVTVSGTNITPGFQ